MGRPRIKVIDEAVDLEKQEKIEKERVKVSREASEKLETLAKKTKKATREKKVTKANLRSKRYEKVASFVDKSKEYPLSEAIEIVKKTANTKFDSSLEVHINLNTDHTKSDQFIRISINLPNGSGHKLRVIVFGGNAVELKKLGVESGTDSTIDKLVSGKVKTDKIISTPEWMVKLTKAAKFLGPKGLMPNPKSGTITLEPEKLVKDMQGGMIEVKTEAQSIIHAITGKISYPTEKLEQNVKTLVEGVQKAKPEGLKKPLIKSAFLSSSMGPSVRLDISSL